MSDSGSGSQTVENCGSPSFSARVSVSRCVRGAMLVAYWPVAGVPAVAVRVEVSILVRRGLAYRYVVRQDGAQLRSRWLGDRPAAAVRKAARADFASDGGSG